MKVRLIHATPDLEIMIAKCAGICYDSKVSEPKKLLRRLKADGHFATFRFAHVSFEISGISRACANQMVRHKFLDFLQRSQRYCNESNAEYIIPDDVCGITDVAVVYANAIIQAKDSYKQLLHLGIKKEDARAVLPLCVSTSLNVVGSVQAWWDFLYGNAGRLQPKAQWEIRELAQEIERQLIVIAPNIFGNKT